MSEPTRALTPRDVLDLDQGPDNDGLATIRELDYRAMFTRLAVLAFAVGAILTALGMFGVGPAAPTKAHAAVTSASSWGAASNGGSCSIPLSDGKLMVTRTTGYIGAGRYWTSIRLESTGDAAKLVWNRGHGFRARGGLVRVARGITGIVDGPRSWGLTSRTPNVKALVGVVDTVTGMHGSTSC